MKLKFLKKYFSVIFVVATLMGVFHHHDTLESHNNCQICIVQSSIADGDMPCEKVYLTKLSQNSESILAQLTNLHPDTYKNPLNARAPPKIS